MSIPLIRKPDGTFAEVQADADGNLRTSVGVEPVTSPPLDDTPAIPVRAVGTTLVEIVDAQPLNATLDLSGSGLPVRTVNEADHATTAANTTAIRTTSQGALDELQGLRTDLSTVARDTTVAGVALAVADVETELQDKATEATLASRASETTAQSTLAAVDQVETKLDTLHTDATNIYGRHGDRRTSDGAAAGGGQIVRPLYDVADFVQTMPGSPTWYLQARNTPGRLKSCKVTLQTTGTPFYVFVLDVANYVIPPAAQPAITTRRHLGFANKGTGNDPGIYIVSFDREEFQSYSSGILIALSTTASTFTPATSALASIESYTLGVPS